MWHIAAYKEFCQNFSIVSICVLALIGQMSYTVYKRR